MRRCLSSFTHIICLFGLWCQAAIGGTPDWTVLSEGMAYRAVSLAYTDETYALSLFKLKLGPVTLSPIVAHGGGYAKPMARADGALLAINANFFDAGKKPLGLVIRNRTILNPLRPVSWWGVFYTRGNEAHIVSQAAFTASDQLESAIQSGPRLIEGGEIISGLKPGASPKSFLCIASSGEVVIGISQDYLPVDTLTSFLKHDLACKSALNLDGGSSSQLYAKIGSFELDLPSPVKVPVMLGVFKP